SNVDASRRILVGAVEQLGIPTILRNRGNSIRATLEETPERSNIFDVATETAAYLRQTIASSRSLAHVNRRPAMVLVMSSIFARAFAAVSYQTSGCTTVASSGVVTS